MTTYSDFGLDDFFNRQLSGAQNGTSVPARIIAEHRGQYRVCVQEQEGPAELAGRLIHELEAESYPGVGDWVMLKSAFVDDGPAIIQRVLKRRTVFVRGASGKQSRGQVIAANVDLVFIVCGLDEDYSVNRIERYLARVWASGATPVVVLNKADICAELEERISEVEDRCIGVSVIATSAQLNQGLENIRSLVQAGQTAAFVGSSGVGKSTIVNALLGKTAMHTAEISARDGRGQHTTTHRQLMLMPGGGMVLDTPGMRELQICDEEGLDAAFVDIDEISLGCRFGDCRHDGEPGCAVADAVQLGQLSPERFENFKKMQREAQAYELRHNEHLRRKTDRVWGQLAAEGVRIRNWKRST